MIGSILLLAVLSGSQSSAHLFTVTTPGAVVDLGGGSSLTFHAGSYDSMLTERPPSFPGDIVAHLGTATIADFTATIGGSLPPEPLLPGGGPLAFFLPVTLAFDNLGPLTFSSGATAIEVRVRHEAGRLYLYSLFSDELRSQLDIYGSVVTMPSR